MAGAQVVWFAQAVLEQIDDDANILAVHSKEPQIKTEESCEVYQFVPIYLEQKPERQPWQNWKNSQESVGQIWWNGNL